MTVREYFRDVLARLTTSPIVRRFEVRSERFAEEEGYLRVRCALINGDLIEMFEYVERHEGRMQSISYSFHWQSRNGELRRRWDNVPHHKNIPTFPAHLHTPEGVLESSTMSFHSVLDAIERELGFAS